MTWQGRRDYEAGIDRGVLYPKVGSGKAWNGLVSVQENPVDTDDDIRYIDGIKFRQNRKLGFLSGTIEAYSYPDILFDNQLTQRRGVGFGLSYRTGISDTYLIHILYDVLIGPTPAAYSQGESTPFRWPFSSTPQEIPGAKRTAHLIVNTAVAYSTAVVDLEDILYGTNTTEPRLPSPQEIVNLFEENAILKIIDNGDGSWTAIGPDLAIVMLDSTSFQITWPSAVYLDAETYRISSL